MERDDDVTRDPETTGGEGDYSRGDSPGGPSQPDEGGFAEGAERETDGDAEREPDFARGVHASDDDTEEAEGRYSRGAEDAETEARSKEGRFSEGIEQLPHERK
jgi:hypothetical protein